MGILEALKNEALRITPLEWAVFISGALCVWLLVKESVWNWPAAIVNQVLCIDLFYRSSLYADAGLQLAFITVSIYGWWNWLHGGQNHSEVKVGHTDRNGWTTYILVTAILTGLLYALLRFTPSNVPFGDGFTTALSLTALYMQTRKVIENWWFWIATDVGSIVLYCYNSLFLTAILFGIYLLMCIAGLREWQRTFRARQLSSATHNTAVAT